MNYVSLKYNGIRSRMLALKNLKEAGSNLIAWFGWESGKTVYVPSGCPSCWISYLDSRGLKTTFSMDGFDYALLPSAVSQSELDSLFDKLPADGAILCADIKGMTASCGYRLTLLSFPDNKNAMQLYSSDHLPSRDELINILPSWRGKNLGDTGIVVFYKTEPSDKLTSVKFNTHRGSKFRLTTLVYAGSKVVKKADSPDALAHLKRIADNASRLSSVMSDIKVIPCHMDGDDLVFEYIKGASLMAGTDLETADMSDIKDKLNAACDKILSYGCETVPFASGEMFERLFPGIQPSADEVCYPLINLDSNIDNFKVSDGRIYCYDCEWTADFPVPLRFVRFRSCFYFYRDNIDKLGSRIDLKAFLGLMGFSGTDIKLFSLMEETFQWYVNGLT